MWYLMWLNLVAAVFSPPSAQKRAKHPAGEPLKTLQSFRTARDNGDVDFGQNLIARNSGVIRVGDEVEILATAPAKFTAQLPLMIPPTSRNNRTQM